MSPREFAPGVLVFYADPYGSVQDQLIWVNERENGLYANVALEPDPSCMSWLSVPRQSWTMLRATPGAAGSYTCRVSILRNGKTLGSVPVYLNVGNATGGTTPGIAAPDSLSFDVISYPSGFDPQTVTVTASSYYATVTTLATNTAPARWTYVSTIAAMDGKVTVRPAANDGLPGMEQLYIEAPAGVAVVRIRERIAQSAVIPLPAGISLSVKGGAPAPDVTFTVTNPLGGNIPLSVASSHSWVKITPPPQQVTPATYALSFDTSMLPNGLNTANITIRAPVENSPVNLPIVLVVSGSNAIPGAIAAAPSSLTFSGIAGAGQLAPQTISVSAATPLNYAAAASTESGGAWLKVVPPGTLSTATTPAIQVGVDVTALAPGIYKGAITLLAPSSGFTRIVPVTLTVTAPPAAPTLSASPTAIAFDYAPGGPLPSSATLQIGGTPGLAFTAQASSDGDWLSVSPASGTVGPATTITVGVQNNAASLPAGGHRGVVTLSTAGAAPVTISVALSVRSPAPSITRVVNAASYAAGPIAPGEMITIFGERLGPAAGAPLSLEGDRVATTAGGVEVVIGGFSAPILYASDRQVSAIVPYEIAVPFLTSPRIVVKYGGESSNEFSVEQANSAPGVFTADSSGAGHAAALNADYTPNSAGQPAGPGEVVLIYMTGEGATAPSGITGKITAVAASAPLTPQPLSRVSVTVDGLPAKIWFYGEAPGIVAGMMQLNVEVPAGARSGEAAVAVTIGSGAGARTTQTGVTISVR